MNTPPRHPPKPSPGPALRQAVPALHRLRQPGLGKRRRLPGGEFAEAEALDLAFEKTVEIELGLEVQEHPAQADGGTVTGPFSLRALWTWNA